MRHLFELVLRRTAHAVRGGGGVVQLGVLGLKAQKLRVHFVIFKIRNFRCIVIVIALRVVVDLAAELFDASFDLCHGKFLSL